VKPGAVQIWKISHNGVDAHPIHFHLFDVQILNRVSWDGINRPTEPNELGWKDTITMNPLQDIIVALRSIKPRVPFAMPNSIRPLNPAVQLGSQEGFSQLDPVDGGNLVPPMTNQFYNFGHEYVWHCHILSHEENDMMRSTVLRVYPVSDFDGDAKTDVAVWRPSNGTWYVLKSSTGLVLNPQTIWGVSTDIPIPGDYDGDGLTDYAVYRPSSGVWFILNSSVGYDNSKYVAYVWGVLAENDKPVPGDYDGDGKADLMVWRPSTGVWFLRQSTDAFDINLYKAYVWGVSTDNVVPGDYDGDGKTDIAVYRPSTGVWQILQSSNGFDPNNQKAYSWGGNATDIPVPGDYDGDGKTDIAVYRASTGTWFILLSSNGYNPVQYRTYVWGNPTDIPVPGDYDGDGYTDIAVYQPSTNGWFILLSSKGYDPAQFQSYTFGVAGDVPLKSLY